MSTTRLRDRIAVSCPIAEAQSRLEAFFAKSRGVDGVTRVGLRVPLGGIAEGLALEHEAKVEARLARDDQNLNDLIRITWRPEDGGPYPTFEGTLVTWAEHDPAETFLELDGWYAPPLGAGGEAFDAVIGRQIARRTARAFLDDIRRAIADAR
jgi:hypothetical protein